jgi:hypothetical protein
VGHSHAGVRTRAREDDPARTFRRSFSRQTPPNVAKPERALVGVRRPIDRRRLAAFGGVWRNQNLLRAIVSACERQALRATASKLLTLLA